jgi:hypothetical protein
LQDFRVGEGLGVCSRSLALHVEASLLLLLFLCSGACLLHPLHFERREESAAKQGLVCSTLFSKTCTHTVPHDAWRCTRSLHLAGRKELANSRTRELVAGVTGFGCAHLAHKRLLVRVVCATAHGGLRIYQVRQECTSRAGYDAMYLSHTHIQAPHWQWYLRQRHWYWPFAY